MMETITDTQIPRRECDGKKKHMDLQRSRTMSEKVSGAQDEGQDPDQQRYIDANTD